jgi:hypothetical protein
MQASVYITAVKGDGEAFYVHVYVHEMNVSGRLSVARVTRTLT